MARRPGGRGRTWQLAAGSVRRSGKDVESMHSAQSLPNSPVSSILGHSTWSWKLCSSALHDLNLRGTFSFLSLGVKRKGLFLFQEWRLKSRQNAKKILQAALKVVQAASPASLQWPIQASFPPLIMRCGFLRADCGAACARPRNSDTAAAEDGRSGS